MKVLKTIHAIAPIRINDIGGWTDTWFSKQGKVLNTAVFPLVEVRIKTLENREKMDQRVLARLENYGEAFWIIPEKPAYDHHPLIQGAFNSIVIPKDIMLQVTLYSHVPAGSSTGTSASVCVALLGALDYLAETNHTVYEIAYLAHRVETEKLKLQSGIQDQLAAAFGGICYVDMYDYPEAKVTKVELDEGLRKELDDRLSLIYLGQSHSSSAIHEEVIAFLEAKGSQYSIIKQLRALAEQAKGALLERDLDSFGDIMIQNNECQRALHEGLISEEANSVIDIAKKFKALGWKVNGAGGKGGSLTVLGSRDVTLRNQMLEEIDSMGRGIRSIPISLTLSGVTVKEETSPDTS
jgi:D-glycero-alpha-D-manno-heptose-7-phosphate kinase